MACKGLSLYQVRPQVGPAPARQAQHLPKVQDPQLGRGPATPAREENAWQRRGAVNYWKALVRTQPVLLGRAPEPLLEHPPDFRAGLAVRLCAA